MNLEAIALRRAEEQVSVSGKELPWNPAWRAAPKPEQPGHRRTCECGGCSKCLKRDYMRRWRSEHPRPPKRRGPSMALGRKCRCGHPIADCNRSGTCRKHRMRQYQGQGADAWEEAA